MGHMKNYRQLLKELPSNKVVFAFGCFQPPTSAHELQVKVVKKLAEEQNSDYIIYASQNLKEDLLPADKKVQYMNLMFPNTNIKTTDVATFVEAAKELNKKYKNIVMVTSSDCKEDYTKILNKRNGSDFFFETIEVVSAGDVNPDDNKLKESAKKGDYVKFKTSMPSSLREIDSRRLMNDMRQSLGLDMVKEKIKLVKDELREQYFRGEIFNIGEIVESDGQQYEIVKRGSNHLLLKEESGKLVSKWIQDVTVVKETTDSPVVNKNSKFNIAKDIMRYKDFKKLNAMAKGQVKEQEETDEPSDMEEFLKTLTKTAETGHTMGSTDDNHRRRKIAYHIGEEFSEDEVQMIDELSTELLGRYKTASAADAKKSDSEGNYAKGDKRFKGINKATNKQFDNDLKKHGQYQKEETELEEAHKVGDKVIIHKGPADVLGKVGHVGEIRKRWAGDTKTYTIDHDKGSIQLKPTHFKTFKEQIEISESAPFKDLKSAVNYASEKVKTHRDKLDGIEIHAHSGGFDVNHTSNSSGRNSLQKIGAKHVKTIYKEEVELEEGTFKYHMDKAIAAHERGDTKKKEYHLGNAKTARYAIPSADYPKHKELFDKYKQMNESSDAYEQSEDHKVKAEMAKGDGNMGAYHAHMVNHHELKGHWHASKGRHEAADKEYEKAERHHNDSLKHPFQEEVEPIEEISQKLAGDYYGAATKKHIEKVGVKPNMYDRIEKDMGKKRKEGIDRAFARITKPVTESIPHIGPVNTNKVNHAGDEPHEEEWEDTGICMEHGKKDCHECSNVGLEEAKKKQKKQADDFKPTAVEVKIKDDSQQLGANNSHGFDAFFNEEEEKEYSEEEIDKMIGDMSEDDIMDAYDDEELAVVDDETGEEIEEKDEDVNESVLMEVLSRIERMRARVRFAKTKSKRERQVKLALRRTSSNATINKRARRLAIKLMKQRMLRGRPASALSIGEKERIEGMIQKRKSVVNRIAMKLTSRVRQVEKARLNHSKFTQGTPAVGQI